MKFMAVILGLFLAGLGLAGCAGPGGSLCEAVSDQDLPTVAPIPAGGFLMGSRDSAEQVVAKGGGDPQYYEREHPQHPVEITKGFAMGVTEVTNDQFAAFVAATGYRTDNEKAGWGFVWKKGWTKVEGAEWRHPKGPKDAIEGMGDHPVVSVSYNDALAYCRWLGRLTGRKYGLPTEAQWEYACRAGTTTPFSTGETITTDQANYFGKKPYADGPKGVYRKKTTPVKSFAPNPWGLHDVHGNVWEWCADYFSPDYYRDSPKVDPAGPAQGKERVVRGGAWNFPGRGVRSARRYGVDPDAGYSIIGFRVMVAE